MSTEPITDQLNEPTDNEQTIAPDGPLVAEDNTTPKTPDEPQDEGNGKRNNEAAKYRVRAKEAEARATAAEEALRAGLAQAHQERDEALAQAKEAALDLAVLKLAQEHSIRHEQDIELLRHEEDETRRRMLAERLGNKPQFKRLDPLYKSGMGDPKLDLSEDGWNSAFK